MTTNDRLIKAVEKFNQELKAFGVETGETYVTLYEDINTTRMVADFKLCKNGNLHYKEFDTFTGKVSQEVDEHYDDDDIRDSLKYWRSALRRAKKYWSIDGETLDKMADGEIADIEEE